MTARFSPWLLSLVPSLAMGCSSASKPVLESHEPANGDDAGSALGAGGSSAETDGGAGLTPARGSDTGGSVNSDAGTNTGRSGSPDAGTSEGGAGTVWGRGTPAAGVTATDKLDLLLVVDNSISMADKQEVLKATIPDLVAHVTNPTDFEPFEDIHVGVITSSLGGFGAPGTCNELEEENDQGRLLGTQQRALDLGLTDGFLRWTPQSDPDVLARGVEQLVARVGEIGCGFESTLEAWYRFLIDPSPPAQIVTEPCPRDPNEACATPQGIDDQLLAQRAAFLRPDSLVAIVVLSDEDDCSMRPTGQFYYPARDDITLPRAASVCASNPNDRCCYACGTSPPSGCPADPVCLQAPFTQDEDPLNLRCFDQKRRFGIDFLYPVERYAAALTNTELRSGDGSFVPNPLFAGNPARDPSMVVFTAVVGVPWQDLQADRTADGSTLPPNTLRFKSAAEMTDTWPLIVGDPARNIRPTDPLMIPSIDPREGTSPEVGPLAPPSAGPGANAANGHEWANPLREDLQYACIFPLAEPRNCTDIVQEDPNRGCDCDGDRVPIDEALNPLCQNPETSAYGRTQFFAKAYPGTRHLLTAQAAGNNAVVASICPRNMADAARPDFGYRPAVRALLERFAQLR